ncbi:hypothetical protein [Bacillus sp. 166amftsu]|uniref:hypothetical protein n=1 Tax=Bacillus sp. 166amftsu TaxID=1761753 RepID=UPI000A863EE7|nr:hypothetical protein [Bacillus sp. 166amftsu]
MKKEENDKEVKRLTRERNKLDNKLDTKDVISHHYDLEVAKEYEGKSIILNISLMIKVILGKK